MAEPLIPELFRFKDAKAMEMDKIFHVDALVGPDDEQSQDESPEQSDQQSAHVATA